MVKLPKPITRLPDKNILDYIFKLGELYNMVKSNRGYKRKLNEIKKLKINDNFTKDTLVDYFVCNKIINLNYLNLLINNIKKYELG